ncbi:MAG: hypothetical protein ACAF41_06670 [Leptolyngbya sp. BL-A-14]
MVQSWFDLEAPIIPGTSAAGFSLGVGLQDISHVLAAARVEEIRPGFRSADAIKNCSDILYIKHRNTSSLNYANGAVRLSFNSRGELCSIFLYKGYLGRLFNSIAIGNSMYDVKAKMPVFYDDLDEMFYPDREIQPDLPNGIAFGASEEPDEQQEWNIWAFSVHDYEHQRYSVLRNDLVKQY